MNCQYCGFPLDEKNLCEHCSNLLTYSFDDIKYIKGTETKANLPPTSSTSAIDKGIHALEGLLFALQLGGNITTPIMTELKTWAEDYKDFSSIQPFSEALPLINCPPENSFEALQAFNDLLWVCNNLGFANKYHDMIIADLKTLSQNLQSIEVELPLTIEQLANLNNWHNSSKNFIAIYPYNEVIKILTTVLRANLFLETEYQQLQTIMQQFPLNNSSLTVESLATIKELSILENIIVSSTELDLTDKNICLTGTFKNYEKIELIKTLLSKKIYPLSNVSPQVSYLIVGASKSSCWPFYSYGRKVEDILTLKKDHHHIKIITEEQLIEFFNKNN